MPDGPAHQLADRIASRTAVVGVIGMGYVGLPAARAFVDAGFRVLAFDSDPAKIDALNAGRTYLAHLGDRFVADLRATGRFEAADPSRLGEPDALLLCVPTPLDETLRPDLSYVEATARDVARALRPGQLVCLESTTYPGTTRDVLAPILATSGFNLGHDFFVAFSPEREDPGRPGHTTRTIPKLVGGLDDRSRALAADLYGAAIDTVVPVSSAEVAEAAKLLENIFRAVNIALVNEMKVALTEMGIDVFEVVRAAATKPFGFMPFEPGPGLGGHCIPIDPFYFSWKAAQIRQPARFIELAGEVNRAMPAYVIDRLERALADAGTPLAGSRVLVLGLAYKPNVDDVRESPALELITLLRERGSDVTYHDPHVPRTHKMRRYDLGMTSVPLTPEALAGVDAVVIATAHKAVDYRLVGEHAKLIIDTRDAMRSVPAPRARIVKA